MVYSVQCYGYDYVVTNLILSYDHSCSTVPVLSMGYGIQSHPGLFLFTVYNYVDDNSVTSIG